MGPGYLCGCQTSPAWQLHLPFPFPVETLSPTQPGSMPQKLRGHDMPMCRQLKMQLRHTGQRGSVSTGSHFHGAIVTGDPSALTDQSCIDFLGSPASLAGRGEQHTQISAEPHGQGLSPGDNQRLPMDTSRTLRPRVPTLHGGDPEKEAGQSSVKKACAVSRSRASPCRNLSF